MNFQEICEEILEAMLDRVEEFGIVGVAAIAVQPSGDIQHPAEGLLFFSDVFGSFTRNPSQLNKMIDDRGTNYGAVCFSKIWESIRTGENSGSTSDTRKGELGYRGCVRWMSPNGNLYFLSYSGGTEDQDVEIAETGKRLLEQNPAA